MQFIKYISIYLYIICQDILRIYTATMLVLIRYVLGFHFSL